MFQKSRPLYIISLSLMLGCGEEVPEQEGLGLNTRTPYSPTQFIATCDATLCQQQSAPQPTPTPQPQQTPQDAAASIDALAADASWAGMCITYGTANDGVNCALSNRLGEHDDRGITGCDSKKAPCCYDPNIDFNQTGIPQDYCANANFAPGYPQQSQLGQCMRSRVEICDAIVLNEDGTYNSTQEGKPSCSSQGTACCYLVVQAPLYLLGECQDPETITFTDQ